jgi:hypothetical protein
MTFFYLKRKRGLSAQSLANHHLTGNRQKTILLEIEWVLRAAYEGGLTPA